MNNNYANPVNNESVSHQFTCVILVQYWYSSTSTCMYVNSRVPHVFTCLTRVILVQNWYDSTSTCVHVFMHVWNW